MAIVDKDDVFGDSLKNHHNDSDIFSLPTTTCDSGGEMLHKCEEDRALLCDDHSSEDARDHKQVNVDKTGIPCHWIKSFMADLSHRKHLRETIAKQTVSAQEIATAMHNIRHYLKYGKWPNKGEALPSFIYHCEGRAGGGKTEGLLDAPYIMIGGRRFCMSGLAHHVKSRLESKASASAVEGNVSKPCLKTLHSNIGFNVGKVDVEKDPKFTTDWKNLVQEAGTILKDNQSEPMSVKEYHRHATMSYTYLFPVVQDILTEGKKWRFYPSMDAKQAWETFEKKGKESDGGDFARAFAAVFGLGRQREDDDEKMSPQETDMLRCQKRFLRSFIENDAFFLDEAGTIPSYFVHLLTLLWWIVRLSSCHLGSITHKITFVAFGSMAQCAVVNFAGSSMLHLAMRSPHPRFTSASVFITNRRNQRTDPLSTAVRSLVDALERGDAPDPQLKHILQKITITPEQFMDPNFVPDVMRITPTHHRCQQFNLAWMKSRTTQSVQEVFMVPVQLLSDDIAELLSRYQVHNCRKLVEGLFGVYTTDVEHLQADDSDHPNESQKKTEETPAYLLRMRKRRLISRVMDEGGPFSDRLRSCPIKVRRGFPANVGLIDAGSQHKYYGAKFAKSQHNTTRDRPLPSFACERIGEDGYVATYLSDDEDDSDDEYEWGDHGSEEICSKDPFAEQKKRLKDPLAPEEITLLRDILGDMGQIFLDRIVRKGLLAGSAHFQNTQYTNIEPMPDCLVTFTPCMGGVSCYEKLPLPTPVTLNVRGCTDNSSGAAADGIFLFDTRTHDDINGTSQNDLDECEDNDANDTARKSDEDEKKDAVDANDMCIVYLPFLVSRKFADKQMLRGGSTVQAQVSGFHGSLEDFRRAHGSEGTAWVASSRLPVYAASVALGYARAYFDALDVRLHAQRQVAECADNKLRLIELVKKAAKDDCGDLEDFAFGDGLDVEALAHKSVEDIGRAYVNHVTEMSAVVRCMCDMAAQSEEMSRDSDEVRECLAYWDVIVKADADAALRKENDGGSSTGSLDSGGHKVSKDQAQQLVTPKCQMQNRDLMSAEERRAAQMDVTQTLKDIFKRWTDFLCSKKVGGTAQALTCDTNAEPYLSFANTPLVIEVNPDKRKLPMLSSTHSGMFRMVSILNADERALGRCKGRNGRLYQWSVTRPFDRGFRPDAEPSCERRHGGLQMSTVGIAGSTLTGAVRAQLREPLLCHKDPTPFVEGVRVVAPALQCSSLKEEDGIGVLYDIPPHTAFHKFNTCLSRIEGEQEGHQRMACSNLLASRIVQWRQRRAVECRCKRAGGNPTKKRKLNGTQNKYQVSVSDKVSFFQQRGNAWFPLFPVQSTRAMIAEKKKQRRNKNTTLKDESTKSDNEHDDVDPPDSDEDESEETTIQDDVVRVTDIYMPQCAYTCVPLSLAQSSTIANVQGDTLPGCVVDDCIGDVSAAKFATSEKAKNLLVASSRAIGCSGGNLFFVDCDFDKIRPTNTPRLKNPFVVM